VVLQISLALDHTFSGFLAYYQTLELSKPVEFYVFAKTTDWTRFERIQADLLDRILSKLLSFGLKVFQVQGLNH